ncbi:HAMP domain-containing sensor histidine kinase [Halobacillus campisalis]|uniref:histidine kinase n=1 Tax=Halobacillus campisalis TaxID=435909 RepID=A0ABW2K942_9BACI|nr:HAMP domain-containing sensor histidine kinase [Halobacillus campisalis]
MSISKRFIRSNITIVLIPVILFLAFEAYLLLYMFDFSVEGNNQLTFVSIHLGGMLLLILLANGLFLYYAMKNFIRPMKQLTKAAEEISAGETETDAPFEQMRKDEVGKLADSFERMRLQLVESNEVQDKYAENREKLLLNMSNELKIPVTFIKEQIEWILSGKANKDDILTSIRAIHVKSIVLDRLIEELFQHSELDMGRLAFDFKRVELRSFLVEIMEEFQMEWEEIAFTFKAEKVQPYEAKADPKQLRRVIIHLLNNSLKHMEKDLKMVDVYLTENKGVISIEVTDNGPGILSHDLPHIFELFYQSQEAKKFSEGGSGLGLPISKRIIEEHDGEIKAESRIGHGTTMTIQLPSDKL